MRRVFSDFLLSACAFAVVLAVIVAFDGRVREQVTMTMSGARASTELVAAQSQSHRLAAVVYAAAKDQVEEHTPLVIFLVVASMLTVFMVRA
jgi:hypothetical protein